jgi:hypothetical protein
MFSRDLQESVLGMAQKQFAVASQSLPEKLFSLAAHKD